MKALPNEALMSLEDIRHAEFSTILETSELPTHLLYDENLRFTDVRPLEALTFAFTKKQQFS